MEIENGGCTAVDSIHIQGSELPEIYMPEDVELCLEDYPMGYVLDLQRTQGDIKWSTGDTTSTLVIHKSGVYEVEVANEFGCVNKDEVNIIPDCMAAVWVPSGFSPNSDFKNDIWELKGIGVFEVNAYVFNRWGELIWEGNQIGDFWDGTFNGVPVQQDVYAYRLEYSYENKQQAVKSKTRVGTITLIR